MKKRQLKTKPTESSTTVMELISTSWTRLKLKRNLASISIKEVLFQETHSESLISKVLILKPVVVLTAIILLRLVGSDY